MLFLNRDEVLGALSLWQHISQPREATPKALPDQWLLLMGSQLAAGIAWPGACSKVDLALHVETMNLSWPGICTFPTSCN